MSAAEYRHWWEANALVAYGFCWCGCGQKTAIPAKSSEKLGRIKGEPMRFLRGHSDRKGPAISPEEYRREWREASPDIPFGCCWCGCGERTRIAPYTMTDRGWVKGEPLHYVNGHHGRVIAEALEGEICRRYEAGEDTGQLAAAFGCHPWSIRNALMKNGVPLRSSRECKVRYSCNDAYFDAIDCEEKAYWLGFIGADGCLVAKGEQTRLLQVKLAAKDADHLFRLRDALGSDCPIYPVQPAPHDPRALQVTSPACSRVWSVTACNRGKRRSTSGPSSFFPIICSGTTSAATSTATGASRGAVGRSASSCSARSGSCWSARRSWWPRSG
jgi:hypothetical protein